MEVVAWKIDSYKYGSMDVPRFFLVFVLGKKSSVDSDNYILFRKESSTVDEIPELDRKKQCQHFGSYYHNTLFAEFI